MAVTIKRTDEAVVITLPPEINPLDIQNALDYFRFVDIVGQSQATEEDIQVLSKTVKAGWSKNIKERLKGMDEFKDLFE